MTVFKVQLDDGRIINADADDQNSAAEAAIKWQKSNPQPKKRGVVSDTIRSTLSGVGQGVASLGNWQKDAARLGASAGGWGAEKLGVITPEQNAMLQEGAAVAIGPTTGEINASDTGRALGLNYQPQTEYGRVGRAIGRAAPGAVIAPGSGLARAAMVGLSGAGAEGARAGAEAIGLGPTGQGIAEAAGGLAGGLASSIRYTPKGPLARRFETQQPNAMMQRAAEYRAAGIEPTAVDVVDQAGRAQVRALASRPTPAQELAQDFGDTRALDLPDRMSDQARRVISPDPRTPDAIRVDMAATRRANADANFGAVRNDPIEISPEGIEALNHPYGRQAVAEAARRERDPQVRQALQLLAEDIANDVVAEARTPITVGMGDRISRVLLSKAQGERLNDPDLAATYTDLGESLRGPMRDASGGYASALHDYAADSRLHQAAGVGEEFLDQNTDEFVNAVGGMSEPERALARAAARRAIERKSGEGSAAPGIARKIANGREQGMRNQALLGPENAMTLQNNMRLEERAVQNARMVAPRTGSQTAYINQDQNAMMQGAQDIARVTGRGMRGDILGAAWDGVTTWMKSRGVNNAEAERLVTMALDPARTDEVIQIVAQRYGQAEAQRFLGLRNALIGAQTASGPALQSMNSQPGQ